MKDAEGQKNLFHNHNLCKLLCMIIVMSLAMLFSPFAFATESLPQPVNIPEGLSKELEDSLIKVEKSGRLIQYLIEKESEFRNQGKYGEIIDLCNWIEKRLTNKNIEDQLLIYKIRSSAYGIIEDYEAMFEDIEKSLDTPKDTELLFNDAISYLNIMYFHLLLGRSEVAQTYFNKALKIVSEHKESDKNKNDWQHLKFLIHITQGQFYKVKQEWEKANSEYSLAEKYSFNDYHMNALNLEKFSFFKRKGEYQLADSIYQNHLIHNNQISFINQFPLLIEYVDLLLKMGLTNIAKNELRKINIDSVYAVYRPNLYAHLSNIYELEGNYQLAHLYVVKYVTLKDSLESKYKRTYATQVADRFEMRQVEKSFAKEHRDNIRNILFIGLLGLALTSAGIIIIIVIRRHRKRKRDQIIAETNLGNRNAALSSAVMVAGNYKNTYQDIKEILGSDESSAKKVADIRMRLKESSNSIEPLHHVNNSNDEAMQEFIDKLRYVHPDLTNAEIRMAQLVVMNLSNKDIAELQKRSLGTIKNQKYSLRKKLGIDMPTETYLKQLSAASPSELEELAKSAQQKA